MRYLILVGLLLVFVPFISAQSDVKIKLRNGQTIEGEWLGIENDHFLIGQGESIIRYIPEGMVLKLKVVPDINSYPGYDKNRNILIWGLSGAFNSTLGQKEKNLQGLGGKISVGYDWEHNYALYVSAGYSNMNIGEPETFFPVSILPVKYLTEGRLLVFAGLEAGMNFGISNPWESAISRRSMNIDRHIS